MPNAPNEAKFLAELLRPEVTLWVNSDTTHAVYYEKLQAKNPDKSIEQLIAAEYANLAKNTTNLVVASGENKNMVDELCGLKAKFRLVTKEDDLKSYQIVGNATSYKLSTGHTYSLPQLLPEAVYCQVAMIDELMKYIKIAPDYDFIKYVPPPGRSTILAGINNTTIVDSSYNANLGSIKVMVDLFDQLDVPEKWLVIGDMLELGKSSQQEHEELAEVIMSLNIKRCLLVGPLTEQFTAPKLKSSASIKTSCFANAKLAKKYIDKNLNGGQAVMFKGSQSIHLEFIIRDLLKNNADAKLLPRQGKFWDKKRAQKGLIDD
jgi:UDP-N-acetylmuramyl pentapeptide synthase